MHPSRASAIVMAALLGACALQSPPSRSGEAGDIPGSWSATKEARAGVDHHWVRKIGGSPLESLISEAHSANPSLKASAARVDQAAAVAKIAGAERLPTVGAGLQGSRQKQNFSGIPGVNGGSTSNSFGVSLQAAWEVDLWGKAKAGTEAAIADAEAQAQADRALRASLAAQVSKAWLAVAETNEQVALAERNVNSRSESTTLVRERFERAIAEDGGSAAQVRLTETELSSAKSELESRKGERERALRQLELLLGRYPSGNVATAAKLPKLPPPPPAGLPSELLLRRPDLLAAERRLAAAGRRADQAEKALYPSISLTGSLGTSTDQLEKILSSSAGVWSLGGSLAQPIFQGGRIRGGIEQADAAEREAVADLQRVTLDAFGEVEQALVTEIYLRRQVAELEQAVTLAEDASERSNEEFRNGTGGVLTYLASQNQEIQASSALVTVRRLLLDNRVNLHLALGGDVVLRGP
ncbi:efflux transporter outer membrane subunit [Luteolibacter luteus]|uniref:TolC family protein n=1 Tax=Luteolibacter luteus TaxID=2728835 RepID=A0A858RN99_9BACT|nr:TolC family protein [Luteolibacter luteus]QJE97829.1 TolC family protein [Luteolibacter luteus]